MTKAELRRQFLTRRKALTPDKVKRRSQRIAWRFFDFLEENDFANVSATIHCFLPIQRQNEVDTWHIIHCLWANFTYLNVAVPVTDVSANALRHYLLFPQTQLVENHWGIPEPVLTDQHPQQPTDFNIVLVPLLAFDQQGQRIGYGGGFYDRFLAECRPDCLKVGLSLFGPVDHMDDVELTDLQLNKCITPEKIYSFK